MADFASSHTCPLHFGPAVLTCGRCGTYVCLSCKLAEASVGIVCEACAPLSSPPRWVKRQRSAEVSLGLALIAGTPIMATVAVLALQKAGVVLGVAYLGAALARVITGTRLWVWFALAVLLFLVAAVFLWPGPQEWDKRMMVAAPQAVVAFAIAACDWSLSRAIAAGKAGPKWTERQLIRHPGLP